MAKIYYYQKVTDEFTTYQAQGEGLVELCTIEGITYVSVPDDGQLSAEQPEQIRLEEADLTDELREKIKAISPLCQLIYVRMQEQIRGRYSAEDEMYLARIAVGQLTGSYVMQPHEPALIAEYQSYIETVREWGRSERAKLGL